MLTIDGSYGEGGGQILRTSVALSAVLQQPIEIVNIRAKRAKPGLQPQHWTGVKSLASLCDAELHGVEVGSMYLQFSPRKKVAGGEYRFNISEMIGRGSAGAINLVFQTLLMPLLLAEKPSTLILEGGTHVPHSPNADYIRLAYLSMLKAAGADVTMEVESSGYYPIGGGKIIYRITPSTLKPIQWTDRGRLKSIESIVTTSSLPEHVAERGAETLKAFLKGRGTKHEPTIERPPSPGTGASVTMAVQCEKGIAGFSALGQRGKPMEKVIEDAFREFEKWWRTDTCVDEHLGDQLMLPMALAGGHSEWTTSEVTEHLLTVIWLIKQFMPLNISIDGERGQPGGVTIHP